jgi:hypothetical protein
MRIVNWLFLISAALFVCGVGLVVVGAREARRAPTAAASAPAVVPVATVKQIMAGIVGPAANAVFNAVSTTVTREGVQEVVPKNDEEWTAVGNQAVALAEAANLLMLDGRAVDRGDWATMSQAMLEAGRTALKAAEAKDKDALLAAGEGVNTSCDSCHRRYMRE